MEEDMNTRFFLTISLIMALGSLWARYDSGAFQIITEPAGASVFLVDSNGFLGISPTTVYPLDYGCDSVRYGGVPGRFMDIRIKLDGYMPINQNVFVPIIHRGHRDSMWRPTVFRFKLERLRHQHGHYNRMYPCRPHPQAPPYYYFVDPAPSTGPTHHGH